MACTLVQWVQSVGSFSSQYGGEHSISYSASNIIGKCNVFPEYGDFTSTYVLVRISSVIVSTIL